MPRPAPPAVAIAVAVASLTSLLAAAPATGPASRPAVPVRWSHPDRDRTPTGVPFHGPFLNETVTATAGPLPPHEWVAISVDLFVLRSWDGSVPIPAQGKWSPDGPDYLRVGILDGPTLAFATFSNLPPDDPGFLDHSKTQNYPSQVPGDRFRAQTGAAERNTLGYNFPWAGPPQLVPMDAVYRLRYVVPHTGPDLSVQLTAMGLSGITDENWGVRDLTVRPLRAADVPTPAPADLAEAFTTSLDVAGDGQPDAFLTLTAGGDATTDWIEHNVQPQPIDGAVAHRLLTDLTAGDDAIAARDAAGPALFALGPQAEVGLRDLRRTAAGEVRARCDTVLQQIGIAPIDGEDLRRVMLATRVLEVIGTPKALALRRRLVGL